MPGQTVSRNAKVLLSGRDFSDDLNTVTVTRNAEAPENTTFKSSTRTRKAAGIKDWAVTFAGLFNDQTGAFEHQAHALLAGSTILGVFPQGVTTACEAGYEGEALEPEYGVESTVEGAVTANAAWSGSGDMHRLFVLKLSSACSTAGSAAGPSRDFTSTDASVTGVVRCTTASGTTPTLDLILQHSNDDSAWSTLITFTQITAGSVAEIKHATGGSRYMRYKWTLGGTNEDFEFMGTAGQD
jgi:hypothetical protein